MATTKTQPSATTGNQHGAKTAVIQQSAEFKTSPETLYEMYMDSAKHSRATGSRAKLGRKAGDAFIAFDGSLRGKNLLVVPGEMVVQAWRSSSWKKADGDSILIMTFRKTAYGARVDLVHVNVPEHDHKGVTAGWPKFYWKPWRAYLSTKA
jgi:activator of HSP90 ATPase